MMSINFCLFILFAAVLIAGTEWWGFMLAIKMTKEFKKTLRSLSLYRKNRR